MLADDALLTISGPIAVTMLNIESLKAAPPIQIRYRTHVNDSCSELILNNLELFDYLTHLDTMDIMDQ